MKLQHIRSSLDDIKKDDLRILEELKVKISNLEGLLNKKYIELNKIQNRKAVINNILDVKDNKRSLFRILRPILELVLMALATFVTIISIESLSALLIIILLIILGMSIDSFNIIQNDYAKLSEKNNSTSQMIIKTLLNIVKKRELLALDMDECMKAEVLVDSEIKQMEEDMSINRGQYDSLKEEISFIEGNSHAVNWLIDKYKFEELSSDNSVVRFIESKKELKKIAPSAKSY